MRDGVHNLGIRDTEVLAEWLFYHLSMELRSQLIAELPVIYGRIYPRVPASRIAGYAESAINTDRGEETA